MDSFTQIKDYVFKKKVEYDLLKKQLAGIEKQLIELKQLYESSLEARAIIQRVGKETQQQLEYHISSIVTTAIVSVFEEEIEFKVEFVERRGKTEVDFYFIKEKEKLNPVTSSGGGLLDIASLALRLSFWNLNRSRNVIIFDEPCKFVSKNMMPRVVDVFKMLSEKLNLQILMVSHIDDFVDDADKNFVIERGRCVDVMENM